jgi:dTDP-4-amino-4,6-dideoxygalactose transaminase
VIAECRRLGQLVQGPRIAEFEQAVAAHLGRGEAITASYGRMAFRYILQALDLQPGSEVVFPALTFWAVPEMARNLGLRPVFADVDAETFNIDPEALERAITPRTRVLVPTHLYGRPAYLDAILRIAERHNLYVVEDCAHALGARYRGKLVGTFGHAAFFSFQTLKPLNTCGGGMAVVAEPRLARSVARLAHAEPWPDEASVRRRLRLGALQRFFTSPTTFTVSGFPVLWTASWLRARPDIYLWEPIRPLQPLPTGYSERYTNVQAALGLAGLRELERWNAETRLNAELLDWALAGVDGVQKPSASADSSAIYYQYPIYVRDREGVLRRAIRRGLDLETLHVDVCTRLDLFRAFRAEAPGAERAAQAIQVPVHCALSGSEIRAVAARLRRSVGAKKRLPSFDCLKV